MSETTHNAEADDEADAEDYCNLDKTEQYAFGLAVKEIIRKTVDENAEFGKGKTEFIENIDAGKTRDIFNRGVYRLRFNFDLCDRNDVLAAVADNPLIEIAELDADAAVLVYAEYFNEYYDMIDEMRSEGDQ